VCRGEGGCPPGGSLGQKHRSPLPPGQSGQKVEEAGLVALEGGAVRVRLLALAGDDGERMPPVLRAMDGTLVRIGYMEINISLCSQT